MGIEFAFIIWSYKWFNLVSSLNYINPILLFNYIHVYGDGLVCSVCDFDITYHRWWYLFAINVSDFD